MQRFPPKGAPPLPLPIGPLSKLKFYRFSDSFESIILASVQAGFPSSAEDGLDKTLDLNELLITHPAATFFVRVAGDSMQNAGISSGDMLIVDRSLEACDNTIVIAVINTEFTVKRLLRREGRVYLAPENPAYPILEITPESDFQVWGVVTYVIHKAR